MSGADVSGCTVTERSRILFSKVRNVAVRPALDDGRYFRRGSPKLSFLSSIPWTAPFLHLRTSLSCMFFLARAILCGFEGVIRVFLSFADLLTDHRLVVMLLLLSSPTQAPALSFRSFPTLVLQKCLV
jgi:hypothetical protein